MGGIRKYLKNTMSYKTALRGLHFPSLFPPMQMSSSSSLPLSHEMKSNPKKPEWKIRCVSLFFIEIFRFLSMGRLGKLLGSFAHRVLYPAGRIFDCFRRRKYEPQPEPTSLPMESLVCST